MNKLEGIELLKQFEYPTVNLLNMDDLVKNNILMEGISIRLSSRNDSIDVNLPSIHNVKNMQVIEDFIKKYGKIYDVLIHKTVKPQVIGTISKYKINDYYIIVVETYKNFLERKHGVINEHISMISIDNIFFNKHYNSENAKILFHKIYPFIKKNCFDEYDIEFVIENNEIVFTDFYSKGYQIKKIKKLEHEIY